MALNCHNYTQKERNYTHFSRICYVFGDFKLKSRSDGFYCGLKWCLGADLNHRHGDFQSPALPLSYQGTFSNDGVNLVYEALL